MNIFFRNCLLKTAKLATVAISGLTRAACTLLLFISATGNIHADISAYYFDQNGQARQYFSGNSISRIDSNIDFNWGTSSPHPAIGNDDFSVRWVGEVEIPLTGDYQFQTLSDDGVRLWVNGTLLIDNWTDHAPRNDTSAVVRLSGGHRYALVMEFYERGGGAVAQLGWSGPGISGFPAIPAANLFPDTSGPTLESAYFDCQRNSISLTFSEGLDRATAENISNYSVNKGVTLSAASLSPDGKRVTLHSARKLGAFNYRITVNNVEDLWGNVISPATLADARLLSTGIQASYYDQLGRRGEYFTGNAVIRTDALINNSWGGSSPLAGIGADDFSVRWEGNLAVAVTGSYTFRTRSDDGVRLWVDDVLIIDNWTDHSARFDSSTPVTLTGGESYAVKMEYYERGGHAVAELHWSGPGIAMGPIAPEYFSTSCQLEAQARWQMNEPSWQSAPGEVIDSSGNGHHGQAFNGATTTGGACLYGVFDGDNDYVEIPHHDALNGVDGLTYMAWIRANSWTGIDQIMAKSVHGGGSGRAQMGIFSAGGVLQARAETIDGRREISTSLPLVAGDWNHVALVFDGESLVLYVDGIEQARSLFSPTALRQTTDPLLVSKRVGSNAYYFHGLMDDVRVYNQALSQAEIADIIATTSTCSIVSGIHHFAIDTGSASASTCAPKAVTIRACADAACATTATNYSGQIDISTSSNHGNWARSAASGILSPDPDSDDNGNAVYTFAAVDRGLVTLDLSNAHADNLTIAVNDYAAGVSNTSAQVQFRDNVFVITQDPLQIAGRDLSMTATLMQRNGADCQVASGYSGDKVLKASLLRHAEDPGGAVPELEGIALPELPLFADITLNFVSGVSHFTLASSDVGKYAVSLLDDTGQFATDVDIGSDAQTLIMRPFGFHIEVRDNPAAATANGTRFIAAGEAMRVTVTAVLWESEDDRIGGVPDGIPDFHDDTNPGNNVSLANNRIAASFSQGSLAESVRLSAYLFAPLPGIDPGLNFGPGNGLISSFSAGSGSITDVSFDEVGIIEIKASLADGDFLGNPAIVTGSSGYVGRFVPHHFEIASIELLNRTDVNTQSGCELGGFTFLDEELSVRFDISAVNSAGNMTLNYDGSFAKLNGATLLGDATGSMQNALNLVASHNSGAYYVGQRLSDRGVAAVNMENGFTPLLQEIKFSMNRDASSGLVPEAAFENTLIAINPIDSDGVQSNGSEIITMAGSPQNFTRLDTTDFYFGRLVVENAYGSELRPLPVWAHSQYCAAVVSSVCSQWVDLSKAAMNDSCTKFSLSAPADTEVAAYWLGGNTFASATQALFRPFDLTQNRGGSAWLMRYIGGDDAVRVDVPALGSTTIETWHPYLLLQQGEISFGSYRGHDRIIYWREINQ